MSHKDQADLILSVSCTDESRRTWALDAPGRNTFRIVVRCRQAQAAVDSGKASGLPIHGHTDIGFLPSRREEQCRRLYSLKGLFRRKQFMDVLRNSFRHTRQFSFIKAVLIAAFVLIRAWFAFLVLSAGLLVG
jgi:hypothetical protein